MYRILFIFLLISLVPSIQADTSVWKATKGDAIVYIGGTIHMLRQSDYPLPPEFNQAFKASQIVTFETDINELSRPEMMQILLKKLSYQDKRTIKSVISKDTYQQLDQYAKQNGLSLNFYRKAKPGMLMTTFLAVELKKMGATVQGIDSHFLKRAIKENKTADFLETPEQQLNFLADMGVGNEESFYKNMLRDFKNTQQQLQQMISHWRSGNAKGLNEIANLPMEKDYPAMHKTLLVDRNNNWMPKIEDYFKTKDVEFVMVGAAHLVGRYGIVEQLKAKGYQIEKL